MSRSDLGWVDTLRALLASVAPDESEVIQRSFAAVVDRLVMSRVLTDSALQPIREMPEVYLAHADQIIDSLLSELNLADFVDTDVRRTIFALAVRGQGSGGRDEVVADATFGGVVSRLARFGHEELRCENCGYHFRQHDLSVIRKKIAVGAGQRLATEIGQNRLSDPVKRPIMTGLEVDHVVPRAGWGSSDQSNLQLLCKLCNQGKAIYLSGLEALSLNVAASYSLVHSIAYGPNRALFFAAVDAADRRCSRCERTSAECELTVRPIDVWFTPWSCSVVCYLCDSEDGV